ncbi:LysM peptidoglycan-binding domain-containing protein [uncultured Cohaesibacter sp.]|uniref:LysM peptidoglycan-binding domain-containing protein n=1 Tax=uncultured Cohaesibacter sp. TaxID=1002546 RepID=UPI0029C6D319|nr:LysM peptidoglycan-binding domain-containing protein [uncultured Cohaesibacter sp.]
MKSATPFIATVCGVFVALVVGVAAFGDRIGLGELAEGINSRLSAVTSLVLPEKKQAQAPVETPKEAASEPETVEKAQETLGKEKADLAPTFDIVRVEPDGNTLVAGRAQPGWIVELKNGSAILSKAVANTNGEWVMILDDPLGAGVSDLSLVAQSKDGGQSIASESSVTVARSEDAGGELLVVETEPGKASKILASIAKPDEAAAKLDNVAGESEPSVAKSEETAPVVAETTEPEVAPSSSVPAQGAVATAAEPQADGKDASGMVVASKSAPAEESGEAVTSEVAVNEPAGQTDASQNVASVGQSISIEAVEIEGDMLFVAGAAAPTGAMLRLYIDNGELANGRSGEMGRFLFDEKFSLENGAHVARVDMINAADGSVLARAEVSFNKLAGGMQIVSAEGTLGDKYQRGVSASAVSGAVETKKIIIRRGDNLWTIARRVYGAGIRYSTIYDTNNDQIRDPHWIYPGQVFELPKGQDGWDNNFDAVESPNLSKVPASGASAVAG